MEGGLLRAPVGVVVVVEGGPHEGGEAGREEGGSDGQRRLQSERQRNGGQCAVRFTAASEKACGWQRARGDASETREGGKHESDERVDSDEQSE